MVRNRYKMAMIGAGTVRVNYHAHTWRCGHASGTEREFIEEAILGGIKYLGFSDHSPMPFPENYISGFRMRMDQLEDYCDTLLALKKEYEKDIEIHIGLEAEYYPLYFDKLLDFLKDYPVEYLLQGQHCLNNEYDGSSSGAPTEEPEILKQYVEQTCEGMKTGHFLYLAHPDLINFTGEKELFQKEMRKICLVAKETGMPLEINFLGLAEGRHYPNPAFWEVVSEVGNDVIWGIDCHHRNMVNMPEVEQAAYAFGERYGLKIIDHIPLHM